MNFGPAERFRALQQQYSDPALTLLTVLLLLLMFVVAPLQATGFLAFQGGGWCGCCGGDDWWCPGHFR